MQFIIRDNGIDEIIVDIPELDKKFVEHYVVDFKQWIREGPVFFVENKMPARRIALLKQIKETESSFYDECRQLFYNDVQICEAFLMRPDYRNRRQRDEEDTFTRVIIEQLLVTQNLVDLEQVYSSNLAKIETLVLPLQERITKAKAQAQTQIEENQARALQMQAERAQKEAEEAAITAQQQAEQQAQIQALIDAAVAAALANQAGN